MDGVAEGSVLPPRTTLWLMRQSDDSEAKMPNGAASISLSSATQPRTRSS